MITESNESAAASATSSFSGPRPPDEAAAAVDAARPDETPSCVAAVVPLVSLTG